MGERGVVGDAHAPLMDAACELYGLSDAMEEARRCGWPTTAGRAGGARWSS